MGYERYPRSTDPRRDDYGRRDRSGYGSNYASGTDYTYSSARDYAAAGRDDHDEHGRGDRDWDRGGYGARGYGQERGGYDRGWQDRGQSSGYRGAYGSDGHRFTENDRDRGRGGERGYGRGGPRREPGYDYEDRGFLSRAGDEVRSWFGDDEAERRRELDQRYDDRYGDDPHYSSWRRERIAELDRDYDEYRRENSQRFSNEFATWRTDRQGQRTSLSKVEEHMEVVGSDGAHVGTVDKVRGDRIILTKNDTDAGGHHHSIPSRWIDQVADNKVTIRKTADEAKAAWRDEDRSAMFNERDDLNRTPGSHMLNRSFSGTY